MNNTKLAHLLCLLMETEEKRLLLILEILKSLDLFVLEREDRISYTSFVYKTLDDCINNNLIRKRYNFKNDKIYYKSFYLNTSVHFDHQKVLKINKLTTEILEVLKEICYHSGNKEDIKKYLNDQYSLETIKKSFEIFESLNMK